MAPLTRRQLDNSRWGWVENVFLSGGQEHVPLMTPWARRFPRVHRASSPAQKTMWPVQLHMTVPQATTHAFSPFARPCQRHSRLCLNSHRQASGTGTAGRASGIHARRNLCPCNAVREPTNACGRMLNSRTPAGAESNSTPAPLAHSSAHRGRMMNGQTPLGAFKRAIQKAKPASSDSLKQAA